MPWLVRAAIPTEQNPNYRNFFPHAPGGWKPELQVWTVWFPSRPLCLVCRQLSSSYVLTWLSLCMSVSQSPLLTGTPVTLDQDPPNPPLPQGPHFMVITSVKAPPSNTVTF